MLGLIGWLINFLTAEFFSWWILKFSDRPGYVYSPTSEAYNSDLLQET